MEKLLQLSGIGGVGPSGSSGCLADQLGGSAMDLQAFDLKVGLQARDVQMGLAAAYLRVRSDEDRRAREIMAA